MKTNQTIKTYDNFKLFAFSKDNELIFGLKLDRHFFVSLNLKNDEEDIISEKYFFDSI
jgi:hypothetical protein